MRSCCLSAVTYGSLPDLYEIRYVYVHIITSTTRLTRRYAAIALQRQTSPHWQLYVYAGDQQAQQRRARIASLLQSFGDPRVRLLELPADTRLENVSPNRSSSPSPSLALLPVCRYTYCIYECIS